MAFARRTGSFGGQANTGAKAIRLAYTLRFSGRNIGSELLARRADAEAESPFLNESDLKTMFGDLHALDQEIVRELRSSQVYGQLGDPQLARLLPLLTRRRTKVGEERLRITDIFLQPRTRVQSDPQGRLEIEFGFTDEDGDWYSPTEGRLLAGPQAYLLRGSKALQVTTEAPWELIMWRGRARLNLDKDLSPTRRDQLVRDLGKAGVPEEDLSLLAIQRGEPDRLLAYLWSPNQLSASPITHVTLSAIYGGVTVPILGQRPDTAFIQGDAASGGLLERDLATEEEARGYLRQLGFRFDRESGAFTGRNETALKALDPQSGLFPQEWTVVRSDAAPVFRDSIEISTQLQLLNDRGLLDLEIDIETVTAESRAAAEIKLKDLIAWLSSGERYVQLEDGSYVAPSDDFRLSLAILEDLGAESNRVLVSPLCVGLLRRLGDSAALKAADDATQAWLDEVTGSCAPETIEVPDTLKATLRDYQQRGIDWLYMLHRHCLTGILADDMGLGKTIQTLALLLLASAKEDKKPSLVVAPTSVVTVWRDQAAEFAPSMKLVLWHGPPKVRHSLDISDADIIVVSYGVLRRDAEFLSAVNFRYVILDEAQSAKNAASQNATSIRLLNSEKRLALTGTPVENRPEELWSTFDFLAPGFLGTLQQFRKRYGRPIERGDKTAMELLHARIKPLVLRRLKTEVAKELPDKIETTLRCEMGAEQRVLYDHIAAQVRQNIQEKVDEKGAERVHLDILAAIMKLRQVCCDPRLLKVPEEFTIPPSAKLELFQEIVREALESERSIIVFSQFVEMQKHIITKVQELGIEPLWLHGGTRNRDEVVAKFQDPKGPPVIVVSLRAGGTGLNLTRADTVIHYDPWWNPAVERQATDRAHRLGQTQQVHVYKLICSESIEERVLALASRKEELVRGLLGSEGSEGGKVITPQEILALLQ
ncbi:MAG: DEAD/DEAH box helicase [Myxococcota bacterium]|nr:DEAD/DEAH box helicase [Myxococcota bacterium]